MKYNIQDVRRVFIIISLLFSVPLVTSCWSVAVKTFAAVFGQQLISVAAHNYSPEYGSQVEELLKTMASETKKAWDEEERVEQQEAAGSGYFQTSAYQQEYDQYSQQQEYTECINCGTDQVYAVDQPVDVASVQQDYAV